MTKDGAPESDEEFFEEIAQAERIGLGDFLMAGALAALAWVVLTFWPFPMPHPVAWGDLAVATGQRPIAAVMPSFFLAIGSFLTSLVGIGGIEKALVLVGRISFAALAFLCYCFLREVLTFASSTRPQHSLRRTTVIRLASLVGTVAFVLADPVWTAGQCFGETTVLLLLTLLAGNAFFSFLRTGSLAWSYVCASLLGLLSAETPFGFLLLIGFVVSNSIAVRNASVAESPFLDPARIAVGKWCMTFFFILFLLLGMALNAWTYLRLGGLSVTGEGVGSIPLAYLLGYWHRITGAANWIGWILWVGVCLTPCVVTYIRYALASDEETFLSYGTGIVSLFCGLIVFSQVTPIPALWFWTYCDIESDYFLSVGLLLGAATLAASVTVLGVDSVCRNHERLAKQMFGQEDGDEFGITEEMKQREIAAQKPSVIRIAVFALAVIALVAAMVPARRMNGPRAMMALVRDALEETVREAGDATYLFTDGNLDEAVELVSAAGGHPLTCLSLLSSGSARDVKLRTRGGIERDKEDLFSFQYDCGTGLRTWIRDRPKRLGPCAVQMGFDLWKRDGKALPPMGGLLSRPLGWTDDAVRRAGIAAAHALAERVLALHVRRTVEKCPDERIHRIFYAVQWRLARLCLYRAESADLAGDAETAVKENTLAARLNDSNATYKRVLAAMTRQNELMMQRLTPREGLQLALVRADFAMGKLYAETILTGDPENPDANFAMGMYYQREHQYTRAESYLKRALIRRPDSPAVYNNLAMLQLEIGRLDAAEANVEKALKLLPESAAVLDTRNQIRKARAKSAAGRK